MTELINYKISELTNYNKKICRNHHNMIKEINYNTHVNKIINGQNGSYYETFELYKLAASRFNININNNLDNNLETIPQKFITFYNNHIINNRLLPKLNLNINQNKSTITDIIYSYILLYHRQQDGYIHVNNIISELLDCDPLIAIHINDIDRLVSNNLYENI
jgi:hypothetical protein